MVGDAYEAILQELSAILKIELHPDENHTCLIDFKEVTVQIEPFSNDELLIASELGTVPTGRYRENLFREALRVNGMPAPLNGILGFSEKTDHLLLFERLPMRDLNGEKVAALLNPFLEKAKIWKEAVSRGEIPAIAGPTGSGTGIFGLRT